MTELTVKEIVARYIGSASMCWEYPELAGIFDTGRAADVVDNLIFDLKLNPDEKVTSRV